MGRDELTVLLGFAPRCSAWPPGTGGWVPGLLMARLAPGNGMHLLRPGLCHPAPEPHRPGLSAVPPPGLRQSTLKSEGKSSAGFGRCCTLSPLA
jgi:hypothetical protein